MKLRRGDGRRPATAVPKARSIDLQRRLRLRVIGATPWVVGIAAPPATAAMKTNARIVIAGSGRGGIAVAIRLMERLDGVSMTIIDFLLPLTALLKRQPN
jgi:hypothetical protein